MADPQRLIDRCRYQAEISVRNPDADDFATSDYRQISRILALLLRVREGCDFGPLRELNDGRPDVLYLDFTGPADPLRDLAELMGGGK